MDDPFDEYQRLGGGSAIEEHRLAASLAGMSTGQYRLALSARSNPSLTRAVMNAACFGSLHETTECLDLYGQIGSIRECIGDLVKWLEILVSSAVYVDSVGSIESLELEVPSYDEAIAACSIPGGSRQDTLRFGVERLLALVLEHHGCRWRAW